MQRDIRHRMGIWGGFLAFGMRGSEKAEADFNEGRRGGKSGFLRHAQGSSVWRRRRRRNS